MKYLVPLLVSLTGCLGGIAYALYRTCTPIENARLHIATFDSNDGDSYNSEIGNVAAQLFQNQDGI